MEEILLRFPHLGQQIFDQLESKSLTKSTEVSRMWQNFIIRENNPSLRMIQDYTKCSKATLKKILRYRKLNDLRYEVDRIYHMNGDGPIFNAAVLGRLDVFKLITDNMKDKNPRRHDDGETPLHFATRSGWLEVCQFIIEHVEDKNPKSNPGLTPLHVAAVLGHLKIFKYIMDKVEDKNPVASGLYSVTPLYMAEHMGHAKIAELIRSTI